MRPKSISSTRPVQEQVLERESYAWGSPLTCCTPVLVTAKGSGLGHLTQGPRDKTGLVIPGSRGEMAAPKDMGVRRRESQNSYSKKKPYNIRQIK